MELGFSTMSQAPAARRTRVLTETRSGAAPAMDKDHS